MIDCANGAAYSVGPKVFRELGAEVQPVFNNPDGLNINESCGATDVTALAKIVKANKADLGIALDGDADRLIMVDHNGEVVDGDELLFIIAISRQREGSLNGGVVGTLMSNLGLEHAPLPPHFLPLLSRLFTLPPQVPLPPRSPRHTPPPSPPVSQHL